MRGDDVPGWVCAAADNKAGGGDVLQAEREHPAPRQGRSAHEGGEEQFQATPKGGEPCRQDGIVQPSPLVIHRVGWYGESCRWGQYIGFCTKEEGDSFLCGCVFNRSFVCIVPPPFGRYNCFSTRRIKRSGPSSSSSQSQPSKCWTRTWGRKGHCTITITMATTAITVVCYESRVLWYLHTVLTYQSHVTSYWHISNQSQLDPRFHMTPNTAELVCFFLETL